MATIANSLVSVRDSRFQALSGFTLKPSSDKSLVVCPPSSLSLRPISRRKDGIASHKRQFVLRAAYRNGGRPNSGSIFVGGFVLGGIVVGALACVYAPQISKALTETDKKELMRRLPKFIYDEEKALEKTRKILTEKIAQLNAAIDDVSSQLRADDEPNGVAVAQDEMEAAT
ncbi:hypothetical protein C4D60_Mb01t20830 [Musa balbisiana]|uniref:Uncharacterized protein n=1 Tax=Musa balbisiana TaxID=52838 RepID=A0A4S8JNY8_MUSBA|nr:hypothetical protein C4D60_Mb01t20830 [Musa balbisiana]